MRNILIMTTPQKAQQTAKRINFYLRHVAGALSLPLSRWTMFELLILEHAKSADSWVKKEFCGEAGGQMSHEQFVVVLSRSKGERKGQTTSDYECTTFIAFSLSFISFFPLMCSRKYHESMQTPLHTHALTMLPNCLRITAMINTAFNLTVVVVVVVFVVFLLLSSVFVEIYA